MDWFDDYFDEFDLLDIGLIGPLVEAFCDDEKEIKKIEKDYFDDNSDEDDDFA